MADNAIGTDADRWPDAGHSFGRPVGSTNIDSERNEFIRGPRWRTRTTGARRNRVAVVTAAGVVATGGTILVAIMWLLAWMGAPTWLVATMWGLPTAAALIWTIARPLPAIATDDDDDGWTTYSILYVLVGEESPRAVPVRIIAAVFLGGPIVWSLFVFGLSTLVGVF